MARYDYRCTSCGETFEVEHGMSEHPEVACLRCGADAERVFSTSGIVLAGSGFYNTDQRDAKRGGETKAEGAAQAESKAESHEAKSGSTSAESAD